MQLTMKLDEIHYGDVAIKAMPLLGQKGKGHPGAIGKTMAAIANLPENLICDIFEAIPLEQKNEIVAAFAMEYKDKILRKINDLSESHRIGVILADYAIDQNLTITAAVGKIDYLCIADRFLPVIKEKLIGMGGLTVMLRPMIQRASAEQLLGLMNRFVGDSIDTFLVSLINQNQRTLVAVVEDAATKQNIRLKIDSLSVAE